MPPKEGLTTTTAREYREKYPNMPTLKLARILKKENTLLYTSIDHARTSLRLIEGKIGKYKRNAIKDKSLLKDGERPRNPYNLPESDETIYEPYILSGHKIIGVFNDIHVPYHSIGALTSSIDICKKEKIDGLLVNGDFWDFHGLSRFVKDPRKKKFGEELNIGCDLLKRFQDIFGCKIYFKYGNHDERQELFLWQRAPELADVPEMQLDHIIETRVPGIEIIKDKRIIKANALNIIHGHEFGQSIFSPVNIARGLFLRGKATALQGHNHITSEHTEPNMNGKIMTTWSVGCLSELHPKYLPINKWNHGFALVSLDENGEDFEVNNKRIYKNKVL